MDSVETWIDVVDEIDVLLPQCVATLSSFYDGTERVFASRPVGSGYYRSGDAESPKMLSNLLCVEASFSLMDVAREQFMSPAGRKDQVCALVKYWESRGPTVDTENQATKDGPDRTVLHGYLASVGLPLAWRLRPSVEGSPAGDHLFAAVCNMGAELLSAIEAIVSREESPARNRPSAQWDHGLFLYNLFRGYHSLSTDWWESTEGNTHQRRVYEEAIGDAKRLTKVGDDLTRHVITPGSIYLTFS